MDNPAKFTKKQLNSIESKVPIGFVNDANNCIYFKIVHSEEQLDSFISGSIYDSFKPSFTHQIVNDNQQIIGYKELRVYIALTPISLFPFVHITFSDVLPEKDDLNQIFSDHFEDLYNDDRALFVEALKKDTEPKGTFVKTIEIHGNTYDIFNFNMTDEFYNENLAFQCLCYFLIDGASAIPFSEGHWEYYTMFQRETEKQGKQWVASCTLVKINRTIDSYCPIISQFLVYPPLQGNGLGTELLFVGI